MNQSPRLYTTLDDDEPVIRLKRDSDRMQLMQCGKNHPDAEMLRRLAACWNACNGVPIEVIEANASGGLPWNVGDQIEARVQESRMREALQDARAVIEQDRAGLADSHTNPHTKKLDADGQAGCDAYDAVLRQIDAAISTTTESTP